METTLQRSWRPAEIGLSAIVVAAIATIVENGFHMIATIAVFFFFSDRMETGLSAPLQK